MKALSVKNLEVSYTREPIIKKISFRVERGDFFVIIGPNGTGKTTLLKSIAGVVPHYDGAIHVLGGNLNKYSARDLAKVVAVVPQQMASDFPFTVHETVLMGRSPHLGLLGIEGRIDYDLAAQAMEFTDITHLTDRRLNQLSGGERQRVAIGRAICQQPQIILLDEPTASLDPAHQIRIMDLMERLRLEQNITVVMVSHDLNLAAMYGNRLLLLKDGRVAAQGAAAEVLTERNLSENYGCAMLVDESPLGGMPRALPIPGRFRR